MLKNSSLPRRTLRCETGSSVKEHLEFPKSPESQGHPTAAVLAPSRIAYGSDSEPYTIPISPKRIGSTVDAALNLSITPETSGVIRDDPTESPRGASGISTEIVADLALDDEDDSGPPLKTLKEDIDGNSSVSASKRGPFPGPYKLSDRFLQPVNSRPLAIGTRRRTFSDGSRTLKSRGGMGQQFSQEGDNILGRIVKGLELIGPRSSAGESRSGQSSSFPKFLTDVNVFPDLPRPARLDYLLSLPPASREEQLKHAWNPDDRSLNIYVMDEDKLTFHRHPVAQSTDCIRGKCGYSRGLHVWKIKWLTRQRGTHAAVGVATADAPLHYVGYTSLVGRDDHSWGWDLRQNKLLHNCREPYSADVPVYPSCLGPDTSFVVPDTFLVVLDMDEGTLSFVVDNQYLGPAFTGLKGKTLYPIVSAVWGHSEISMIYVGGLRPDPLPLTELSRYVIRQEVGKRHKNFSKAVNSMVLPSTIKDFLLYRQPR
ncbi:unnamed protein product [Notodromas monacha]|uniref:B30.2/SPRY domain-containing protein n=1 Tax=Notodromas monacha TaxID=399045 RepID=A0A7R9BP21_9CRUS|nr:unnamed protein product [Notodromas monacha]CAG0919065.1 unnamed protein product [Notodromas monacha]